MKKYELVPSNQFKKDVKVLQKRGYDLSLLTTTIDILAEGKKLPERFKDHGLSGDYANFKECHIKPDWLLIYKIEETELILILTRSGSHSDLF